MANFPEYDPDEDVIRLNGGAVILLTFLMKAKFGDRFDPEALLHPGLSQLIRDLDKSDAPLFDRNPKFGSEELHAIATEIYGQSWQSGWWTLTAKEQASCVQDAVSPWVLPDEDVERVIESVENLRWNNARILKAADDAKTS